MSLFDTNSQIKDTTSTFDETLQSYDDTPQDISQDVCDLQAEYERKLREEEATNDDVEVTKSQSSDKREEKRASHSKQGSSSSNKTRKQKQNPVSRTKRGTHDSMTFCETDPVFLSAANEEHSNEKGYVKKERNSLSSSLPAAVIKTEISKSDGKGRKIKRRTSDSISEMSKDNDEYKCLEEKSMSLSLISERRRNRNRERREKKVEEYTQSLSSSRNKTALLDLEKSPEKFGRIPLGEHIVDTSFQLENVRIQQVRCRKKEQTTLKSKTLDNYKVTDETKLLDKSSRPKTVHKSYTPPSMLLSQPISHEGIFQRSDKVTNDNLVGSEEYVSGCSKCKITVPAISYCLQCQCYLCQICLRRHDKSTTQLHIVLKGNEIPGSFTIKQGEKCAKHPTKNVTCFCEKHACLCCTECIKDDHANCAKQPIESMLIQIPDISKLRNKFSKACKQKLASLQKLCIELKDDKDVEASVKDMTIEDIEKKSSVMIDHIKKLEKESIKNVTEYIGEVKLKREKAIEECEQNIKLMFENIRYLDEPKCTRKSAIRTVEKLKQIEIQSLLNQTDETKDFSSANKCKFIVNEKLYKTVTDATFLGELSVKVSPEGNKTTSMMEQSLLCDASETIETASKLFDTDISSCSYEKNATDNFSVSELQIIPIWTEGDLLTRTCCTAIEVIDDGTILVSDKDNKKLKWFDSMFSLKKAFNLRSEPWGITRIIPNKYLVTLPMEKSYQELDIFEGEITLRNTVVLGIESTCAVQLNDNLLFTGIAYDKPKFLLTNLDGTRISFILTEKEFDIFKRPCHLQKSLLNPDIIFVSDVDKGVFGIDVVQRKILYHYADTSLLCSMGMATTESGLLYVCSQQTQSLHCLSHEGQFLYSVSLQNLKTLILPQCMCYIRGHDEFLVVHDNSYNIFRLKLQNK